MCHIKLWCDQWCDVGLPYGVIELAYQRFHFLKLVIFVNEIIVSIHSIDLGKTST